MVIPLNGHPWKVFSGTIQEWELFDTKERFVRNLRKNRNLLEVNGWLEKKIYYNFNNEGFRSDEFSNDRNSILFLGCSLTFGTGLPLEEIYAYQLCRSLNMTYYNLALGASSNDTSFRLAYYYIPKLLPKIVICLSPEPTRLELWDDEQVHFFRYQIPEYSNNEFYKKWLLNDNNSFLNQKKNILAIENICISNKIKFKTYDSNEMFAPDIWVDSDFARDLSHPGRHTHKRVHDKILSSLD